MMTFGGESLSSSLGRKRRVAAKGWGGRRIGQVFGQPLAECEIFFGRTRLESPRLINLGTKKRTFAYGLNHLSSNFSVDLHCRPLRASLFFCTTPHLEAQDHVVLVSTLHCHRLVLTPQTSPSCTTIAPLLERSSHHPRSPCVGEDPSTYVITNQETEPSPLLQTKIVAFNHEPIAKAIRDHRHLCIVDTTGDHEPIAKETRDYCPLGYNTTPHGENSIEEDKDQDSCFTDPFPIDPPKVSDPIYVPSSKSEPSIESTFEN
ncbi:hypothetical protein CK203_076855 [Vitis vinifera]|uniref:Uncharacterized protein n=1 Tax=Vitis vinifera TaxID=29760 RepID=A0A438ET97_VITVI|nr:hypothetical protein CK203_076855 [Vitis vinifera]